MNRWIWSAASALCFLGVLMTAAHAAETVIVAEGELFTPQDENGWRPTHQENSWASHTYGGMWVLHGGLLGAPADSRGSVAIKKVQVLVAGNYRVWSRYQAPPYFNFMHRVEVAQNGKTVFSHIFGRMDAERLWSFNAGPYRQLWWFWGVDHDAGESPAATAALQAGEAEIRLITVEQDQPAADPMVDCIVLTTDPSDTFGNPRALVDIVSAASSLYVRFQNTSDQPAQLSVTVWHKCQPNYGSSSTQIPDEPVPPGQWSTWTNIAPLTTWVHDLPITVALPGGKPFRVQLARDAAGQDISGDLTVSSGHTIIVPIDVTWNRNAKILTSEHHARQLVEAARKTWRTANKGLKPKEILYFGAFTLRPHEVSWGMALKDALGYNTLLPDPYVRSPIDGYHQHCHDIAELQRYVENMTAQQKASFRVMSFGDEIHIAPLAADDPAMQEAFVAWLKARNIGAAQLGVPPDQALLSNPNKSARIEWYAHQFRYQRAFDRYVQMTRFAKEHIGPHVETGANYSPHQMPQYYGNVPMYIDIFKQNGMTMYWTEDYIFSVPQPPQFFSWQYALAHCATKYHNQKIHMYVMPHAPGQTPEFFRRNMVYAIGAGSRHIDNFWVAPMENFSENFISWTYPEQFRILHESIYDSAEAEPYVVGGKLRPARIAIIYSRATDYNESRTTFAHPQDQFLRRVSNPPQNLPQDVCRVDQQFLFLAIKHAHHAVDLITEDDIVDGILKNYDVVYFAGEWIDDRIPERLAAWIENGGTLFATAGLGIKNQYNEPYDGLLKVLGLKAASLEKDLYLCRTFLELPLAQPIDRITIGESVIPAIGMRQELALDTAHVMGTWANGRPAVTVNTIGNGKAFAVGTLAGHTYMKTGLRVVPWARGGRKMAYNPTQFDPAATALAQLALNATEVPRDAECSNPFVEALVMDSDRGTLVTLVNWDNQTIETLTVKVRLPATPASVRSVQQQRELRGWSFENGTLTFTTSLEWADYFLMPKK